MNATVNTDLVLNDVRLSFPKVIKPETFKAKDGTVSQPRYSAVFLIPKTNTAVIAKVKEMMMATAVAKWGPEDGPTELKRLVGNNKICLIDGDNTDYDGYEGHYALRTSSTPEYPPTLVNEYAKEMDRNDPATAAKFYAGCFVNAVVRFWAQGVESGFGKRLNCNPGGIQFLRDGEAFGGGGKVQPDAFAPVTPTNAFDDSAKAPASVADVW